MTFVFSNVIDRTISHLLILAGANADHSHPVPSDRTSHNHSTRSRRRVRGDPVTRFVGDDQTVNWFTAAS